jgi:hypothetical protein
MPVTRATKITLAQMRAAGVSGVLVYCSDYRCWSVLPRSLFMPTVEALPPGGLEEPRQ